MCIYVQCDRTKLTANTCWCFLKPYYDAKYVYIRRSSGFTFVTLRIRSVYLERIFRLSWALLNFFDKNSIKSIAPRHSAVKHTSKLFCFQISGLKTDSVKLSTVINLSTFKNVMRVDGVDIYLEWGRPLTQFFILKYYSKQKSVLRYVSKLHRFSL